jgi:glucose/arabinose dehydrogenase
MGVRIHALPIVSFLFFLLVAREIYPYVEPLNSEVIDGYEIIKVASGFGGPTCLEWADNVTLLMCDRDSGRILALNSTDGFRSTTLVSNLNHPHGLHLTQDHLFVSEEGKLTRYDRSGMEFNNSTILVDNIPRGNHQTNAINALPNGTLIWHSGSTCNVCEEDDPRNGALLWVNPETGAHGILASGVRNSFDGTWVPGMGYLFSDNGRDWDGDHPNEEVNLLVEGAAYGWPDDDPEHPVPFGTLGPVAEWTPHTSLNGMDLRPHNSELPGLNETQGFTLYATVYGSWNTLLPKGHEIVRIDFTLQDPNSSLPSEQWDSKVTRFATDLGTPLPLRFGPDGSLYYATFGSGGTLYRITAS